MLKQFDKETIRSIEKESKIEKLDTAFNGYCNLNKIEYSTTSIGKKYNPMSENLESEFQMVHNIERIFLKKMKRNIKHQLNNNEIQRSTLKTFPNFSLLKEIKNSKNLKKCNYFNKHKIMKKNIKFARKTSSNYENLLPEFQDKFLERINYMKESNYLECNKISSFKRLYSKSFMSNINNHHKRFEKIMKYPKNNDAKSLEGINKIWKERKFNLIMSLEKKLYGKNFSHFEKFPIKKKIRSHKYYRFCMNYNNLNMSNNQIIQRNKIIYDYRKLLKESPLPTDSQSVENQNKNPNTDNLCTSKDISSKNDENLKEKCESNDLEKANTKSNDIFDVETDKIIIVKSNESVNNELNKTEDADLKTNPNKDFIQNQKEIRSEENIIPINDDKEIPKIEKINSLKDKTTSKSKSYNSQENLSELKDNKNLPKARKNTSKEDLRIAKVEENLANQKLISLSERKVSTELESLENTASLIPFQENQDESILSDKLSDASLQNEISDSSIEQPVLDDEINNPKFWKKKFYYIKPANLYDKRLACVIRAKPGSIVKKKDLKCELLNSEEEIPYLDKRENYASFIFTISPRDAETKFQFETPWHLAIPYYPLLNKVKEPIIMIRNEELNKWIESATSEVSFDNENQNSLKFVETKISKPYGTFAVVSSLCKDVIVITKEGSQITCMSDRNVSLSVPQDSLKISINTCIQVISIDNLFWKEIKEKHGKGLLDQINFTSSIIEIEAKKKKLTIPASLTMKLMDNVVKEQDVTLKKEKKEKPEDDEVKLEDDKVLTLKKELNPFQKTLLMERINNTNIIRDMHLLSYIHEEDRWFETKENALIFSSNKSQVSIQIQVLQTSKFIILQSKRNTSEETLTKVAKLIENEFCVRNCIIALFQSTQIPNEFALTISLKKYFQQNVKILLEEGYVLDSKNDLVHVELHERQIITSKFVENVKNINHKTFQSLFTFHTLLPNIHKFKVQELDSNAQRAVLTFRGYLNLFITSLIRKPLNNTESKIRKNQIQYTWVEENIMIGHFLICINKKIIPPYPSFMDYHFKFKNYHICFSFLKKISRKIGPNWWDLGLHLGVTETRMQSIKLHNEKRGVNKMAENMLLFWLKGCETQENKIELLKVALRNCGRHEILDWLFKSQEHHLIFGC